MSRHKPRIIDPILDALEPRTLFSAVQLGEFFVPVSGLTTGYALAEGDFDGDGRTDVVNRIADRAGNRFALFLNRGRVDSAGLGRVRFVQAPDLPLSLPTSSQFYQSQIVAGRFDGDDDLDLLVINPLPDSANDGAGGIRVRLLKGDGHGRFTACRQSMTSVITLDGFGAGHPASLDGPGARDSVVVLSGVGLFTFKVGNNGAIAVPRRQLTDQLPAEPQFDNPRFGDIDGDGRTDLVVRESTGSGNIYFIRSRAQSSLELTAAPREIAESIAYSTFILADTNADPSRLEFVYTSGADVVSLDFDSAPGQPLAFPAPRVLVTLPNPPLTYPDMSRSFEIRAVTDADSDGRLDLLTETITVTSERGNPSYSALNLMLANDSGGYSTLMVANSYGYSVGADLNWALRDYDGDGIKDVYSSTRRDVRRIVRSDAIRPPTISQVTISDFDLLRGRRTIIASGVAPPAGKVTKVQFIFDANHSGVLDAGDSFVAGDRQQDSPGVWSGRLRFDHEYGGPGMARFFAVAFDEFGFRGPAAFVDIMLM